MSVKVAVLGAGNMGTAIAHVVSSNGFKVSLWNFSGDVEPLKQITHECENKKYLPGIKLSSDIKPEREISVALRDSRVVFFTLPSAFMPSLIKQAKPFLANGAVCVDVSKGIDKESLSTIPLLMKKLLKRQKIAAISGPAIACDMASGQFTAMNIAAENKKTSDQVKKVLENKNLKLVPVSDLIGMELCGSFKNIYAIAVGICDGLNMPMNTKSVLLVKALRELDAIVKKLGGKNGTAYDLCGLGDLAGTAFCEKSRNRRFGEYLSSGQGKDAALLSVGQTVEGIEAVKSLLLLARKHKIKISLALTIDRIISGTLKPADGIRTILSKQDDQKN